MGSLIPPKKFIPDTEKPKCQSEKYLDRMKELSKSLTPRQFFYAVFRLFIISSFAVGTTSCASIQKRFQKTKTIEKIETLSTTTITESVDTNFVIPSNESIFNTDIKTIINDGFVGEDNGVEVLINVDKATGKTSVKTKTKAKTIPFKFDRTTVIKSKSNATIREKTKTKDVQKEGLKLPWFKIAFGATLALFIIIIIVSRRARDKLCQSIGIKREPLL